MAALSGPHCDVLLWHHGATMEHDAATRVSAALQEQRSSTTTQHYNNKATALGVVAAT
jgi:hypothetical protein